jgi:hypothetical protein
MASCGQDHFTAFGTSIGRLAFAKAVNDPSSSNVWRSSASGLRFVRIEDTTFDMPTPSAVKSKGYSASSLTSASIRLGRRIVVGISVRHQSPHG